ncbi:ribonuclease kappa [Anaeramoeba flamelloides]|uniref:Ribonuclease kappa n=1 Tax=Anaeramoeba flamelloides TaxID=1746091 RepID=A0AAV8AE96_9EUKA|nr:ribonuclease kappa [Anaeramoeba flamelloides]KAJ3452611.1 ribonuclease kappa [Anaeramoeba flamelloides]KAJ6241325.1 ribonuclease kappa [Anaeramoeba flamelloides]KAJ6241328.1 ribonuclease kappa [Anaeramoeba flamelloides]
MLKPGKKGSIFCILISIWGVVMLLILGILFQTGHQGNIGHYGDNDPKDLARDLFIAAAIYFVFLLGCGFRYRHVVKKEQNLELERVINEKEFDLD